MNKQELLRTSNGKNLSCVWDWTLTFRKSPRTC